MSIGTNIRRLREERNLTQEALADRLGVTFQTVSAWERDKNNPETEKLQQLAAVFNVSMSELMEEKEVFDLKTSLFSWEKMKTYIKTTAREKHMNETLRAVDFAEEKHAGQFRKNSDIPYIYHPLTLACHAMAMGLYDDTLISACLLHDTVEDCGVTKEELPVNERCREVVQLVTHADEPNCTKEEALAKYYAAIKKDPMACMVKCIDRCNNLTTMSWGFSRKKRIEYIRETEQYYPEMLRVIKAVPEYYNAAWLLKYQIESMLDIYKRLS